MTKLVIMIPTKGTMKTRTVESLLKSFPVFLENKLDFRVVFSEGTLLTHLRNSLVDLALKDEKGTHFLFIDSDMVFEPEWILNMINKNCDFITGIARCRGRKVLNIMKYIPAIKMYEALSENELTQEIIEIDAVGMSFFLMKRNALEIVIRDKKGMQDYFLTKEKETASPRLKKYYENLGKDDGLFKAIGKKSEDVLFCEDIKSLGFRIYAYTPARLGHIVEEILNV